MSTSHEEISYGAIALRIIAIVVNAIGFLFLLTLAYMARRDIINAPAEWVTLLVVFGFSPLIVTTYFLWYLKDPEENIFGIFIVTPIVIILHYLITGIFAHINNSAYVIDAYIVEFILAISFIVVSIRRGHVRHKSNKNTNPS